MTTSTGLPPGYAGPGPAAATPARTGPGLLVLRVCGLLVTLAVVGVGAAALVAAFFTQVSARTSVLGTAVTRVVADVDTGTVRVHTGAAGSAAQVTTTRRWSFDAPTTSSAVDAGTVRLTGRCAGTVHLAPCTVDLDLTVPPGTALELTVGTGDVHVDGATGPLRLVVGTGDVTGTGLRSSTAQAVAGTGDVRLVFLAAPSIVTARTTTGDVTVQVPGSQAYRVDAHVSVGSQSVTAPTDPTSARTIEATATVGDVQVRAG